MQICAVFKWSQDFDPECISKAWFFKSSYMECFWEGFLPEISPEMTTNTDCFEIGIKTL